MAHAFSLGRLFDIRVGVHASWFIVFALATWSIASGLTINVPRTLGVVLAATCALGLFASVLAHEFAHALVARRYELRTESITLFLFGGVATLECEPRTARAEVAIALAGPIASAVLAVVAYAFAVAIDRFGGSGTVAAVTWTFCCYIAAANAALTLFNLFPAYPMDGGRVLRACVWGMSGDRARATAMASLLGCAIGVMGIAASATAYAVDAAWLFGWTALLAGFVTYNSWTSYRRVRTPTTASAQP